MKLEMFRCKSCGKLLFKFNLNGSIVIEIKCPRCGDLNKKEIKVD